MIELLISYLREIGVNFGFFRLIDYVTFRFIASMITSLTFVILFGHRIIVELYERGIRDAGEGYASVDISSKRGTPTAGGLIFIFSTVISSLIWIRWNNSFVKLLLAGLLYFGIVGFIDDYLKVRFKSSLFGLSEKMKTLLQLLFIIPFSLYIFSDFSPIPDAIKLKFYIPFYKNPLFELNYFIYAVFAVFVLFSVVNAVNLTDGLDGLATGTSIPVCAVYIGFAYIIGNKILSTHFLFPYIRNLGEVSVFLSGLVGGLFGFLWYNTYPAEVFMGDTGSLSIGIVLGMSAFFTKEEMLFPLVGAIFVVTIFSSLIQEKIGMRIGRRIFTRAPIHHTFTVRGIAESKLVVRYWIISLFLALLAALSIKLR